MLNLTDTHTETIRFFALAHDILVPITSMSYPSHHVTLSGSNKSTGMTVEISPTMGWYLTVRLHHGVYVGPTPRASLDFSMSIITPSYTGEIKGSMDFETDAQVLLDVLASTLKTFDFLATKRVYDEATIKAREEANMRAIEFVQGVASLIDDYARSGTEGTIELDGHSGDNEASILIVHLAHTNGSTVSITYRTEDDPQHGLRTWLTSSVYGHDMLPNLSMTHVPGEFADDVDIIGEVATRRAADVI